MKRSLVFLALFVILLLLPSAVYGQTPVIFDQMVIEIWPEYDRPDALVIYRIQLADDVSLPAQVSLLIPRRVGEPFSVAFQDMDGLLYNLQYTKEVQGNFIKLVLSTPTAGLQVEYYDPDLSSEGEKRQYRFEWGADYPINNLSIAIQQPVNASDMQILPSFGPGVLKEDGFTYFVSNVGKVNAGQKIAVEMSYSKPDDELSAGPLPVQAAQPLDEDTPGRTRSNELLPWILGEIGLVLLVGGFSWFRLTRSQASPAADSRRRHRAASARRTEEVTEADAVYCHQCGRRAAPGDLFCRTCGARLRGE